MGIRKHLTGYQSTKHPCRCRKCGKQTVGQYPAVTLFGRPTLRCVRHKCVGGQYPKHRTPGEPTDASQEPQEPPAVAA